MNVHCECDADQGVSCGDRCANCADQDASYDRPLANDDGSLKAHGGAAEGANPTASDEVVN